MDSVRETMMELTQLRKINWNISKVREKWKDLVAAAKSLSGLKSLKKNTVYYKPFYIAVKLKNKPITVQVE